MERRKIIFSSSVNKPAPVAFVTLVKKHFSEVTTPRLFSGWPYFILILASMLLGSARLQSQPSSRDSSRSLLGVNVVANHK